MQQVKHATPRSKKNDTQNSISGVNEAVQPFKKRDILYSKLSYRVKRFYLGGWGHFISRWVFPGSLILLVLTWVLTYPETHRKFSSVRDAVVHKILGLSEYEIKFLEIRGASEATSDEIRRFLALDLPVNSLMLDFPLLKQRMENLGAVAVADIYAPIGGTLVVSIQERLPVLRWQNAQGVFLIDKDGIILREIDARWDFLDLDMVIGPGAQNHVAQARSLFEKARALDVDIVGLRFSEVGRWDILLGENKIMMLPQEDTLESLEFIMRKNRDNRLFDREIAYVDARIKGRLTVQIKKDASENVINKVNVVQQQSRLE